MPRASQDASGLRNRRRLMLESLEVRRLLAANLATPAPPEAEALSLTETLWNASTGNLPLSQTFQLESRPAAQRTIYLDFNGYVARGTAWNRKTGADRLVSQAWSLDRDRTTWSRSERQAIQQIWASVAEDFAPFDVNVTTRNPRPGDLQRDGVWDNRFGTRVVIGTDPGIAPGSLGIAYIGSFEWSTDTPAYVFAGDPRDVAIAVSHEVGHTLGLRHDGTTGSAYYAGSRGWGPIMGNPLSQAVTQWSQGEYFGSNNSEDDLAIIASGGVGFLPDDVGDTVASARWLTPRANGSLTTAGRIGNPTDQDVFRFEAGAGPLTFQVDTLPGAANLNVELALFGPNGSRIATVNPRGQLDADLQLNLPTSGTYTAVVRGAGLSESGVSTNYGSLGFYRITATAATAAATTATPAIATVTATPESPAPKPATVVVSPAAAQLQSSLFRSKRTRLISASRPSTVASSINVTGIAGAVENITIRVDLDHTWVGDLELWLESPTGRRIPLVRRRGGKTDNARIEFRADADRSINTARRLFGSFRPEGDLDQFRGSDPNGRWRLIVRDRAYRDGGRLRGWSIKLETRAATSAALVDAAAPERGRGSLRHDIDNREPARSSPQPASASDSTVTRSAPTRSVASLVEVGAEHHQRRVGRHARLRAVDTYFASTAIGDQGSEELGDWLNLLSRRSSNRGT